MFEFFEHTADLGIRVRSPDLNDLFVEAAQALFAAIVEEPAQVRPQNRVDVDLGPDELAFLLFDWLNELLIRFDADGLVLGRFEARVHENGLKGSAWGEPLDRSRHILSHEVKAITYHELKVQKEPDGWLAEVIVDI